MNVLLINSLYGEITQICTEIKCRYCVKAKHTCFAEVKFLLEKGLDKMNLKKILSIALAAVMTLSCASFTAFASNEETVALPECEARPLADSELAIESVIGDLTLDYGMYFKALEEYDAQNPSQWADWLADFEITFSNDATAILVGNYGNYGWIPLAADEAYKDVINLDYVKELGYSPAGYHFKANQPVKVMSEMLMEIAPFFDISSGGFTYQDVLKFVEEFWCGVIFADSVPDGTTVKVELRVYPTEVEVVDGHKQFTVTVPEGYAVNDAVEYTFSNPEAPFEADATVEEKLDAINNGEIDIEKEYNTVLNIIADMTPEQKEEISAETMLALAETEGFEADAAAAKVYPVGEYLFDTEGTAAIVADEDYTDAADDAYLLSKGTVYDVTFKDDNGNDVIPEIPVLVAVPYEGAVADVLHKHNGVIESLDFVQENGIVYFVMTKFSPASIIPKADEIAVQFEETEESKTAEGYKIYDIKLVSTNGIDINRLTSADLTFVNNSVLAADNSKKIPYVISVDGDSVVDGMSLEKTATDRYMFSFDGVTEQDETAVEITIGQVRFDGYGELDFAVKAEAKDALGNNSNVINTTTTIDNIVEHYIENGSLLGGKYAELVLGTDTDANGPMVGVIKDTDIAVPQRTLTINVTFPNTVTDQNYKYQDMVVTVKGTDPETSKVKTFTYNLGVNGDKAMDTNGNYVIEESLVKGDTYTVTVTGAGYRTASYDVQMTDAKALTFWNNVMDAPKAVEKNLATGAEAELKNVTFLAGDIVKDDNINIYDLSAVVSYFATKTTTTGEDTNAQYDLNRDGMIDSKDVAYVLVSWGN